MKKNILLIASTLTGAPLSAQAVNSIVGNSLIGTGGWDYSPSYMIDQFDSNKHKMWTCSNRGDGYDGIAYTERTGTSSPFPTPIIVATLPTNSDKKSKSISNDINDGAVTLGLGTPLDHQYSWEGSHMCDPTVIRGNFFVKLSGASNTFSYVMYYTTNASSYGAGEANIIGAAFSNDGKKGWRHPTPITNDCLTKSGSDTYTVNINVCPNGKYGTGQAVAMSKNGNSEVRIVYFRDVVVNGQPTVDYSVADAKEGINFTKIGNLNWMGLQWFADKVRAPNATTDNAGNISPTAVAPSYRNGKYTFLMTNACGAVEGTFSDSGGKASRSGTQTCVYEKPFVTWNDMLSTSSTNWSIVGSTNQPYIPSSYSSIANSLTGFLGQFESGFKTDAYGWVQGQAALSVAILFGCMQANITSADTRFSYFQRSDICWDDVIY